MNYLISKILLLLILCISLWNCQKLPTIESFTTRNVPKGSASKLIWKVSKAEKIYLIDHQKDNQKIELATTESSYKFTPESDFKYTLVVENKGKIAQKTISGKVLKRMPVITFFRGSESHTVGQANPALLEWKVSNAKLIYISKYAFDLVSESAIEIFPDSSTNYELVAIGEYGDTVRAFHQIKTEKLNGKLEFESKQILAGDSSKLRWDFPNASWVMIKGVSDTLKAKGSYTFVPNQYTNYLDISVTIKYPNKKEVLIQNVRAEVVPIKMDFRASKLKIEAGEEVSLNWNTKGAKDVNLWIGDKIYEGQANKGEFSFFPHKNVEVKLLATDKFNRIHEKSWLIKCEVKRPFIKNAIDYQTFKQAKNAHKNTPFRLITEIFQVDRSNYPNQVKLKVLVTDTLGNFVKGLAPPDISEQESKKFFLEIIEKTDLQSYTIKDFKVLEVNQLKSQPYDIALCLDYSGSMIGSIYAMEETIKKFINKKETDDRYSIIKFDDKLKLVSKMEIDENKLNKLNWEGLDGFGGSTALYAGVDEALESFVNDTPNRQKIIFVFTDGAENSSFQHFETRLFNATDVVKKARKMGVKVYPIGLGDGTNEDVLQLLGWMTDGKAYQIFDNEAIDSVYTELPRIFKNYYEISYKTPTNASNTKTGKVDLKLKYNNQIKITTTNTAYQTHENFGLDEEEGYLNPNKKTTQKIIVATQAVAFFDFDKYSLKLHYTENIASIAKYLLSNQNAKIDILGHTDLVGTPEKNMELSQKRAEEVAQFLEGKGIRRDRMFIKPMGETNPIWNPDSQAWQSQENRRIEITVWE